MLSVALCQWVPLARASTPIPTDIGNLGGGQASVSAVANGLAVGSSTTTSGESHAYLWSAATRTMRDLGVIPGTQYSFSNGVNSNGEVVGRSYGFNSDFTVFTSYAFYWSAATGMRNINTGTASVINDSGVVGGVDANGHVFRWTLAGGLQDLGQSCAASSDTYVTGINARGDVIGNSGYSNGGYNCSFIAYGSSSALTTLVSPGNQNYPPYSEINMGAVDIRANAINDSGVVVGQYFDAGYIYGIYNIACGGFFNVAVHNSHAFKWTSAEGFTDLGGFGGTAASANAINNSGTIVGTGYLPNPNPCGGTLQYAPFVYVAGQPLTQLPAPWSPEAWISAGGINDDGVIVGYAGSGLRSVMWQNGIPTDITPSFANQFPGTPFIKGSTIGGNGADASWNSHAWVLLLPSVKKIEYTWVASGFGACSATCGGGTATQTVTCTGSDGSIDGSGAACAGQIPPPTSQSCNTQACPVDCLVESQGFGACSAACGGGTQTEILTVLIQPANGGAACRDPITQACNTQACDTDGDGVVDTLDSCPGTTAGAKVNASGCSGPQVVANLCSPTATYKNHGAYVSCVASASNQAVKDGLLTSSQKSPIQSAAAQSSIGK
ncbi:MAG: hypothetical protein HY422_02085 [Candidatus Komeilibacteria bacterium]|nr:hypothetical protein [Candidatus Komeilibacteria bacterium]